MVNHRKNPQQDHAARDYAVRRYYAAVAIIRDHAATLITVYTPEITPTRKHARDHVKYSPYARDYAVRRYYAALAIIRDPPPKLQSKTP